MKVLFAHKFYGKKGGGTRISAVGILSSRYGVDQKRAGFIRDEVY